MLGRKDTTQIQDCAAQGLSQAQTAEIVGVNRERIRQIAARDGIVFLSGKRAGLRPLKCKDEIVASAASGFTKTETAANLGVTIRNVFNVAKHLGFVFKSGRRTVDVVALRHLAKEGMSGTEAAKVLGMFPSNVYRIAKRAGIVLRNGRQNSGLQVQR